MISIVNPAGKPRDERFERAPCPARLEGLRLGLLDNGKQNADLMVQEVGRLMGERTNFASIRYMPRLRPGIDPNDRAKTGGYDVVLKELVQECDVVVNGVGD